MDDGAAMRMPPERHRRDGEHDKDGYAKGQGRQHAGEGSHGTAAILAPSNRRREDPPGRIMPRQPLNFHGVKD
ncbi:hypothetical protein GCM10011504_18610 [Siccirubricoccus deserti]|nr:hypothetical protein GCM10011504_18610 [Siccirubricoccus deserti]